MTNAEHVISENTNSLKSVRLEFVKILSYIASTCLFLIVVFAIIYIFIPEMATDFEGIPLEFPHSDVVNRILAFVVNSIDNLFTYVFLVVVGIMSFIGAHWMEVEIVEELEGAKEEVETPDGAKLKVLKREKVLLTDKKQKEEREKVEEPVSPEATGVYEEKLLNSATADLEERSPQMKMARQEKVVPKGVSMSNEKVDKTGDDDIEAREPKKAIKEIRRTIEREKEMSNEISVGEGTLEEEPHEEQETSFDLKQEEEEKNSEGHRHLIMGGRKEMAKLHRLRSASPDDLQRSLHEVVNVRQGDDKGENREKQGDSG